MEVQLTWEGLSRAVAGPVGDLVGFGLEQIGTAIGADGTWDVGVDTGVRLDGTDAVRAAGGAHDAADAFLRAAAVLGVPEPPRPGATDPVTDATPEVDPDARWGHRVGSR
jgi:hypothetical protein